MINAPCERCAEAYGHGRTCPTIKKNGSIKTHAEAEKAWQRGKLDAEQNTSATGADEANVHYMLGRAYQTREANGTIPRRPRRSIRVPIQSEPRLFAVTSIARSD